jgi:hypothetical protein
MARSELVDDGHNYRRLRIRWERDPVVHMAFLTLACALICRRYLMGF